MKFSKINSPYAGATTRRWNWTKLFGSQDYGKDYDFLLLMGDKDKRFMSQYPDDGSPYVFFFIPAPNVAMVVSKGGTFGSLAQLNTNLKTARSPASQALKKHIVSSSVIVSLLENAKELAT